jgi:hypothetical protein
MNFITMSNNGTPFAIIVAEDPEAANAFINGQCGDNREFCAGMAARRFDNNIIDLEMATLSQIEQFNHSLVCEQVNGLLPNPEYFVAWLTPIPPARRAAYHPSERAQFSRPPANPEWSATRLNCAMTAAT